MVGSGPPFPISTNEQAGRARIIPQVLAALTRERCPAAAIGSRASTLAIHQAVRKPLVSRTV